MGRSLLALFLLCSMLFSVGHAALTFHDISNLLLPHSTSADKGAVPDHHLHGEATSTLPTPEEAGGGAGAGEGELENSKTRVDFGTKAWPYVYYARRDREGTLDWGTKSWPYVFYSKREEDKDLQAATSDAGAGAGAAVHLGRKGGDGLRI